MTSNNLKLPWSAERGYVRNAEGSFVGLFDPADGARIAAYAVNAVGDAGNLDHFTAYLDAGTRVVAETLRLDDDAHRHLRRFASALLRSLADLARETARAANANPPTFPACVVCGDEIQTCNCNPPCGPCAFNMPGEPCDVCGYAPPEDKPDNDGRASGCSKCENCGRVHEDDLLINPIPGLLERVAPGELFPSGECPNCGALCHPVPRSWRNPITDQDGDGAGDDGIPSPPADALPDPEPEPVDTREPGPVVSLAKLAGILWREDSIIDAEDVPLLLDVIRDEAVAEPFPRCRACGLAVVPGTLRACDCAKPEPAPNLTP